jgi:type IV secretory pathway VirB3-like protein
MANFTPDLTHHEYNFISSYLEMIEAQTQVPQKDYWSTKVFDREPLPYTTQADEL